MISAKTQCFGVYPLTPKECQCNNSLPLLVSYVMYLFNCVNIGTVGLLAYVNIFYLPGFFN